MGKISATGHALLGLIAMRPTSTYELAQWMRLSNLRALWPRAESQVYKEPKRLVAEGLAKSDEEWIGERRRTVYRITRRGREAIQKWLGAPNDRFSYRSEALVKVSFGSYGSLEDLRHNVQDVLEEAEDDARQMLEFARRRRDQDSPVPEREHVNALADAFILEIIEARIRWGRAAQQQVSSWHSAEPDARSRKQARELWTQFEARLEKLLAEADSREER